MKRKLYITAVVLSMILGGCYSFSVQHEIAASQEAKWTKNLELTSDDFYGITYGNGMFVAVGFDGTIKTSVDGAIWSPRKSGTYTSLRDVAWNGKRFVAVGGTIISSVDGVSWAKSSNVQSKYLNSIVWDGSKFVCVGVEGEILTSSDGQTWISRKAPSKKELVGVAWNGGKYIVISSEGSILISSDAVKWTEVFQTSGNLNSVAWNGKQFAIVGSYWSDKEQTTDGLVLTSSDGVKWGVNKLEIQSGLFGITTKENQFVAVGGWAEEGESGGIVLSSTNGTKWAVLKNDFNKPLYNVRCNGKQLIAVGAGNIVSYDLKNWLEKQSGYEQSFNDVAWGNHQFVTVGDEGIILTSTDGVKWFRQSSGTKRKLFSITFGNDKFVAGGDGGLILTSQDGVTWKKTTLEVEGRNITSVIWNGTQFIAAGTCVLTSVDGYTWTKQSSDAVINHVLWDKNRLIAINNSNVIAQSKDGRIWTTLLILKDKSIKTLISNKRIYIAAGQGVFTSSDGLNWNEKTSLKNYTINGATWGNNQFTLVGEDGAILTSNNGVSWETVNSGTKKSINSVIYADGKFVTVGENGTILIGN